MAKKCFHCVKWLKEGFKVIVSKSRVVIVWWRPILSMGQIAKKAKVPPPEGGGMGVVLFHQNDQVFAGAPELLRVKNTQHILTVCIGCQ